jgi:acyl carrier protein
MRPGRPVSLGRPLAGTRVHVVDDDLLQVPIGVPGELCIGGVGLSRGYLDRPGLTAERFVPDPFSAAPGARLYRTGDLARYRSDRTLEFLGRGDDQVKLRGHRIELGEVETALCSHPMVGQAVVVLRHADPAPGDGPDHVPGPGDARLVGYVVLSPAGDRDGDGSPHATLLRHLRERLPDHMIPSSLLFLNDLPTTPTGKVDRRRLPPPERGRPELGGAYVPPRTALEEEIGGLVAGLLDLERVGVEDDFFDLGGHSLLAARLITQLQRRYRVELALQELFIAPTVSHLAGQIAEELAREQRFRNQGERLRRAVGELPDATVDSLLATLLEGDSGDGVGAVDADLNGTG